LELCWRCVSSSSTRLDAKRQEMVLSSAICEALALAGGAASARPESCAWSRRRPTGGGSGSWRNGSVAAGVAAAAHKRVFAAATERVSIKATAALCNATRGAVKLGSLDQESISSQSKP
jgi:hypothetical protein